MKEEIEGRWVTINGAHVFIKDGQSPMDAFIRQGAKKNQPKRLSKEEYKKMCDEFEENLTEEERKKLSSYTIGAHVSQMMNDPNYYNYPKTYRFYENGKLKEKKYTLKEILNVELDKEASYTKTKNSNWDDNIQFNYDMAKMYQDDLKTIDNIFEKKGMTYDKDFVVYRKGFETTQDLENGFTRNGYTSTSAISRINKRTPGGLMLGDNEFEIIVPKGMKVLPLENIVNDDIKNQHEILLPRGIEFEYVGTKKTYEVYGNTKLPTGKEWHVVRAKQSK